MALKRSLHILTQQSLVIMSISNLKKILSLKRETRQKNDPNLRKAVFNKQSKDTALKTMDPALYLCMDWEA